jgi:hypothetical protein
MHLWHLILNREVLVPDFVQELAEDQPDKHITHSEFEWIRSAVAY